MNFLFSNKLKFSECSKRYFSWVEADGLLSKSSVEKYKEIASRLLIMLGDMNIRKIDGHTITNLKQQLNNNQLSASRKNHHIVVLKNILKYVAEEENIKTYNHDLIKKFKIPAKQVKTLDKEGLQKLINSLRDDNISRLRLKTAVICLISCGCRVSELLKLNISDVDLESGRAQVIAKGGKMHTLIFNELAMAYIKKYLAMRAEHAILWTKIK